MFLNGLRLYAYIETIRIEKGKFLMSKSSDSVNNLKFNRIMALC